jgi:la-related protein 6
MSAQNTNEEINTKALDDSMSSSDNLNESMTVVGIEMQSTLETNESESTTANVLAECDSIQNLRPSTSAASEAAASSDSLDNSGDEGIGDIMDEAESSSFSNNTNSSDCTFDESCFRAIDLQPKIKVAVADEIIIPTDLIDLKSEMNEEEADADTLSPLVIDNHVYVEHCEMMKHANREIPGAYDHFEDDYEEEEEEEEEEEDVTSASPPVFLKCPSTKDSFSSTDSDVSYSYESKKSPTEANLLDPHSLSDDNKDSGCDLKNKSNSSDEDAPIEIPDDEFCERIVEQVEFYFSNESLLKDAFLLKHVRRNKEGFVSLKLVSSFKRVRALTKDWRVVGIAIKRKSNKIELNDIETKIRRLDPLPVHDETMPSRTVVATNLPCEKLTIEKVYEIFAKCGEIALVRILRPNCSIPADVRQFVNKHPELQQNECALVEFIESSSARKAQKMNGIIVFELVLPKKKTGKKAVNMTKMIENFKYNSESENERTRGGENIMGNRFHLKRNNSGPQFLRNDVHSFTPSPRKMSLGNENVYTPPMFSEQQIYEIPARRNSNCSPIQTPLDRKYSNCSDGYSSCGEALSRRQSMCSDVQRRLSNCSSDVQSRRSSLGCVDYCSCGSRRMSQFSNASDMSFRRMSNGSVNDFQRKFSIGSQNIRKYSNTSSPGDIRRVSYDRRNSGASINLERKFSNGFDPMRKLSQTSDYYINGRKVSTDSGYDRRLSINSITYDNENPITRSRNNSLVICQNHAVNEPLIRKPIGPDPDSKGFGARTRKIGLINVTSDGNVVISP